MRQEQEVSPGCETECLYPSNHSSDAPHAAFQTESGSHSDRRGRTLSETERQEVHHLDAPAGSRAAADTPTHAERRSSQDPPQLRPAAPH